MEKLEPFEKNINGRKISVEILKPSEHSPNSGYYDPKTGKIKIFIIADALSVRNLYKEIYMTVLHEIIHSIQYEQNKSGYFRVKDNILVINAIYYKKYCFYVS